MKTFLLAGHAGFYNRGCEAIVRSTVSLLRERFGDVRIILSSFDHRRDRALGIWGDVAVIPASSGRWSKGWAFRQWGKLTRSRRTWRCDFAPLWRPLRDADAVLSIGGDNYSMDYAYPSYYLALTRLAHEAGKPLVIWGASIGPFPPGVVCDEVMDNLRQVDLIAARESVTVQYLASCGVTANVRRVADPGFLLHAQPVDTSAFWPDASGVLGLNVSPILGKYRDDGNSAPVLESVVESVRHSVHELGLGVLLIPHVTGPFSRNDCTALQHILESAQCPGKVTLMPPCYNASETRYVISQCRFLVAARTHAAIAGFASGVPTVSISYSQKAQGINQDVFGNLRHVVDVRTVTGPALVSAITTLVENEEKIRAHLATVMPEIRERARSAVDYLGDVLAARGIAPAAKATAMSGAISTSYLRDHPELQPQAGIGVNRAQALRQALSGTPRRPRLRVCIVGNATWPHVQRWAEHLLARGHAVALLSPTPAHIEGAQLFAYPGPDRPGIPWPYTIMRRFRSFAREWQPDIVHIHSIESSGVAPALCRFRPIVATAYGLDICWAHLPPRTRRDRWYKRTILRHADAVTATSSFLAGATAAFAGLPKEAVHRIPFGVDLRKFPPTNPPPDGPLKLAVVKDLKEEYGPDLAISAFARIAAEIPRASLTLLGDGPLRSGLEERARILGLADRVIFHGRVPKEEVPALLSSVHIVMMPSRVEALGVSALEAQALGLPVVASRVGGIPEAVRDGETGLLVEPDDATALANAVLSLARDPQRRMKMGRLGRAFVQAHYEWATIAARMEDLYFTLLSRVPGRARPTAAPTDESTDEVKTRVAGADGTDDGMVGREA